MTKPSWYGVLEPVYFARFGAGYAVFRGRILLFEIFPKESHEAQKRGDRTACQPDDVV